MRALTVQPGAANSARLDEVPEPDPALGGLLVQAIALGICGTDREIVAAQYGTAPPGRQRLILGHESLGRVLEAPRGSTFAPGDLVAGIVRMPDPEPCPNCAAGEWDMCSNGRYTEHGIKGLNGFGAERWRVPDGFAVRVDPQLGLCGVLTEPASVIAKAWEHVAYIGQRARWYPQKVLVTGAGPVGLLAALDGVQRGYEVHVLDRDAEGPKPELVKRMGATYHVGGVDQVAAQCDIMLECTGAPALVLALIEHTRPNAIVCLAGVSSRGRTIPLDVGQVNRELVLENNVVFGSVNANRRHYEAAAALLARADRELLEAIVRRRVPLDRWREALENRDDDVKTVLMFEKEVG